MRFDTSQQMKLGQQMRLAPRMIQSMEILQLPLMALRERIEQELEGNVALELAGPEEEGGEGAPAPGEDGEAAGEARAQAAATAAEGTAEGVLDVGSDGTGEHDFARLDSFEEAYSAPEEREGTRSDERRAQGPEEYTPRVRREDGERDGKMDAMANTAARGPSLHEALASQWGLVDLPPRVRALGDMVIAALDGDGFLRTPLDDVASRAEAPWAPVVGAELEDVLGLVQASLDPPGVAARDTRECLLLQIDALEREDPGLEFSLERSIVERRMDDLLANRLPKIAEDEGVPLERVTAALAHLRRLDLAPGRILVDEAPAAVVPDAIVEYDEEHDRYVAYLNDRALPSLRINREYAMMARDKGMEKPAREFIRTNLGNAEWLIDAVEQRRNTLLRVLRVVAEAQRDFFDAGPQSLRPLPMTQVADQLGVHVATVSRAVSGKHLLTPRGVYPLRRFFSGGTQTDAGEEVSWEAVRAAMQEVVDAEDKSNPLSDDAIADGLKARGVEIARRTVAKYRAQLNIPSARMRRKY